MWSERGLPGECTIQASWSGDMHTCHNNIKNV
jgi:hypothetical protein